MQYRIISINMVYEYLTLRIVRIGFYENFVYLELLK